jgi:hypothetical protein
MASNGHMIGTENGSAVDSLPLHAVTRNDGSVELPLRRPVMLGPVRN